MRKAIVLDPDDIKALVAEKFDVEPKDVIKSQYSYTVILNSYTVILKEDAEEETAEQMVRDGA